jgi:hypothetical protein
MPNPAVRWAAWGTRPVMHEDAPISSTRIRGPGPGLGAREMLVCASWTAPWRGAAGAGPWLPAWNVAVVNGRCPRASAGWCRVTEGAGGPGRAPAVVNIGHPTFRGCDLSVEAAPATSRGELYGPSAWSSERLREAEPSRRRGPAPGPGRLCARKMPYSRSGTRRMSELTVDKRGRRRRHATLREPSLCPTVVSSTGSGRAAAGAVQDPVNAGLSCIASAGLGAPRGHRGGPGRAETSAWPASTRRC